jgi:hypothetical protein
MIRGRQKTRQGKMRRLQSNEKDPKQPQERRSKQQSNERSGEWKLSSEGSKPRGRGKNGNLQRLGNMENMAAVVKRR